MRIALTSSSSSSSLIDTATIDSMNVATSGSANTANQRWRRRMTGHGERIGRFLFVFSFGHDGNGG